MKKLKKYLLLLVLLLVASLPCYSEDYYLTEEELQTLELNLANQKQQLEMQEKQLSTLKIQLNLLDQQLTISSQALMNAQTSWQLSEKEDLKNKIEIGAWASLIGILLGGVTASLIIYNK